MNNNSIKQSFSKNKYIKINKYRFLAFPEKLYNLYLDLKKFCFYINKNNKKIYFESPIIIINDKYIQINIIVFFDEEKIMIIFNNELYKVFSLTKFNIKQFKNFFNNLNLLNSMNYINNSFYIQNHKFYIYNTINQKYENNLKLFFKNNFYRLIKSSISSNIIIIKNNNIIYSSDKGVKIDYFNANIIPLENSKLKSSTIINSSPSLPIKSHQNQQSSTIINSSPSLPIKSHQNQQQLTPSIYKTVNIPIIKSHQNQQQLTPSIYKTVNIPIIKSHQNQQSSTIINSSPSLPIKSLQNQQQLTPSIYKTMNIPNKINQPYITPYSTINNFEKKCILPIDNSEKKISPIDKLPYSLWGNYKIEELYKHYIECIISLINNKNINKKSIKCDQCIPLIYKNDKNYKNKNSIYNILNNYNNIIYTDDIILVDCIFYHNNKYYYYDKKLKLSIITDKLIFKYTYVIYRKNNTIDTYYNDVTYNTIGSNVIKNIDSIFMYTNTI